MADVVLVFLSREHDGGTQVLLGRKKTGFGVGKVVAPGGHVEPGETAVQAAARELLEETSISASQEDLNWVGRVRFRFPLNPAWDMDTEVFTATQFTGEAVESDELRPAWYRLEALPTEHMWGDAPHWTSALISGPPSEFTVVMADDGDNVASVMSYALPR